MAAGFKQRSAMRFKDWSITTARGRFAVLEEFLIAEP